MRFTSRVVIAFTLAGLLGPSRTFAQVNFEKSGYYFSLGDTIAASEPRSRKGWRYLHATPWHCDCSVTVAQ